MSRYFLYGAGLFSFLSLPIPFAIRRSQTTESYWRADNRKLQSRARTCPSRTSPEPEHGGGQAPALPLIEGGS